MTVTKPEEEGNVELGGMQFSEHQNQTSEDRFESEELLI